MLPISIGIQYNRPPHTFPAGRRGFGKFGLMHVPHCFPSGHRKYSYNIGNDLVPIYAKLRECMERWRNEADFYPSLRNSDFPWLVDHICYLALISFFFPSVLCLLPPPLPPLLPLTLSLPWHNGTELAKFSPLFLALSFSFLFLSLSFAQHIDIYGSAIRLSIPAKPPP